MDLLLRIKMILAAPHREWRAIAQEKREASAALPYVAILALLPALCHYIGASLVGGYAAIPWSLVGALISYLSSFAVVYIVALVINALAPTFGAQRDFAAALKLAVYSYTPVWLAEAFLIVPGLSFLVIMGLYGVYLLRSGLPILMRVAEAQAWRYAAVVGICALVLAIGLGAVEAPFFGTTG